METNHSTKNFRAWIVAASLLGVLALGCSAKPASHTSPGLSAPTHAHEATSTTSPIVGHCPTPTSCKVDYRHGAWYVDNVRVPGVSCPTEDSCYPMYHADERGYMVHQAQP